jgi:hypothetical protein
MPHHIRGWVSLSTFLRGVFPQPAKDQQRVHERHHVPWRVSLQCSDWHFVASVAAANTSSEGLFIPTNRVPSVGALVEVRITLPNGSSLRLRGTAKHVITPERAGPEGSIPGVHVAIHSAHEIELVLLAEMAAAETADRRKNVAPPDASAKTSSSEIPRYRLPSSTMSTTEALNDKEDE